MDNDTDISSTLEIDAESYDRIAGAFDGCHFTHLNIDAAEAYEWSHPVDLTQISDTEEYRYVVQSVEIDHSLPEKAVVLKAVLSIDTPPLPELPKTIKLQMASFSGPPSIADLYAVRKAHETLLHSYLTLM